MAISEEDVFEDLDKETDRLVLDFLKKTITYNLDNLEDCFFWNGMYNIRGKDKPI